MNNDISYFNTSNVFTSTNINSYNSLNNPISVISGSNIENYDPLLLITVNNLRRRRTLIVENTSSDEEYYSDNSL
jgi:hypothetical protein